MATEEIHKSEECASYKAMIFTNEPRHPDEEQLSEGRQKLQKWLGRMLRITLKNKTVLMGVFSCTDRDRNLVITNCDASYEDEETVSYEIVTVQGAEIQTIEVDMLTEEQEEQLKQEELAEMAEQLNNEENLENPENQSEEVCGAEEKSDETEG